MLCLNSTEAERARGCVFAERFESPTHVAKNRGTVVGTVPINFGATYPGVNGNYITYSCGSLWNKPCVNMVAEVIPYFDPGDGLFHTFSETSAAVEYTLFKWTDNHIYVYVAGAGNILDSALAAYSPYWFINKRNVLVAACFTGSNHMWLNGIQIATSVTAWTPINPSVLFVGAGSAAGANTFSGKYLSYKLLTGSVVSSKLTQAEAMDYYQAG